MPPYSPVEVEFQLQMGDVFLPRLELAVWNKYLIVWLPVLLFTGYLLIAPFMGVSELNGTTIDPVTASIPWLGFFLGYPLFIYFSTRSFLKTSRAVQGKLRYGFSENAVELSGDGTYSQISWSNIHKVVETRTALVLYPSSAGFLVIPKRSFAASDSLDIVRKLIRSRVSGKVQMQR